MKHPLLFRSTCALFSVGMPLWLTMHLPSDSAFTGMAQGATFEPWHGLIVFSMLLMMALMAGVFARS